MTLSSWSNATSDAARAVAAAAAAANTTTAVMPTDGPADDDAAVTAASHSTCFLILYFALGMGSIAVGLVRTSTLVVGSVAASRRLHAALLAKVARLPMR